MGCGKESDIALALELGDGRLELLPLDLPLPPLLLEAAPRPNDMGAVVGARAGAWIAAAWVEGRRGEGRELRESGTMR